jgi:hypothetical protein
MNATLSSKSKTIVERQIDPTVPRNRVTLFLAHEQIDTSPNIAFEINSFYKGVSALKPLNSYVRINRCTKRVTSIEEGRMTPNEHDLLFGRLARRMRLVTLDQLNEVQEIAASRTDVDLASLMIEMELITDAQWDEIEQRISQLVSENDGDIRRVIRAVEIDPWAESARVSDPFEPTIVPKPKPSSSPGLNDKPIDDDSHDPAAYEETFISNQGGDDPQQVEKPNPNSGGKPDSEAPKNESSEASEDYAHEETIRRDYSGVPDKDDASAPPPGVKVRLDTLDKNPTQNSRYSLTRLCGKGGLGEVWLTEDPNLNREIALKRFRTDKVLGPGIQNQLIMEAQITGQLEHPNIITEPPGRRLPVLHDEALTWGDAGKIHQEIHPSTHKQRSRITATARIAECIYRHL